MLSPDLDAATLIRKQTKRRTMIALRMLSWVKISQLELRVSPLLKLSNKRSPLDLTVSSTFLVDSVFSTRALET